jgi:lipid A 4'-phosphatase
MRKGILADFLIPLLAAVAATGAIDLAGADLAVQALFYSPGEGWVLGNREPWAFLYHFGNLPAFALGAMGGIAFVLSFVSRRYRPDRTAALFVVALLALAPGLIVNTVFKDHWGRPRPADIVQFGGTETYRSFWNPGPPEQGRSFPSGHAAVGFFLMAPFFVLRRKAPGWARRALVAGVLYGLTMGLGRMIQGGHFLTDVIWSGFMVYLSGLFLYYLFRLDREGLT